MIHQKMWVADDGSYGMGSVAIVDTRYWADENWADFEEASDGERMDLALEISEHIRRTQ